MDNFDFNFDFNDLTGAGSEPTFPSQNAVPSGDPFTAQASDPFNFDFNSNTSVNDGMNSNFNFNPNQNPMDSVPQNNPFEMPGSVNNMGVTPNPNPNPNLNVTVPVQQSNGRIESLLSGINYKKSAIIVGGAVLAFSILLMFINKAANKPKSVKPLVDTTVVSEQSANLSPVDDSYQRVVDIDYNSLDKCNPQKCTATLTLHKKQLTLVGSDLHYTLLFDIMGEEHPYYVSETVYNKVSKGGKFEIYYTVYTTSGGSNYVLITSASML